MKTKQLRHVDFSPSSRSSPVGAGDGRSREENQQQQQQLLYQNNHHDATCSHISNTRESENCSLGSGDTSGAAAGGSGVTSGPVDVVEVPAAAVTAASTSLSTVSGGNKHPDNVIDNVKKEKDPKNKEEDQETASTVTRSKTKRVKLYRSTRLKGYIVLALASFVNFDAARKSSSTLSITTAIPATSQQRSYAIAASSVSAAFATLIVLIHFDSFTRLEQLWWIPAFRNTSKIELGIILVFCIWWVIATLVQTMLGGAASDGRGQFSLYFSTWGACSTSFLILEQWTVGAGGSTVRNFITSWPYRAPVWIVILFLAIICLICFLDVWQNYPKLTQVDEKPLYDFFDSIPLSQFQWLIVVTTFTICSALGFTLVELLRDTKPDGSNAEKTHLESVIEGITFLVLAIVWTPTVVIATTAGGAASLVGNSYFFIWTLVVFSFEGLTWWIHDYRLEMHKIIRTKALEYQQRQEEVLEQTKRQQQFIQQQRVQQQQQQQDSSSEGEGDEDTGGAAWLDDEYENEGNETSSTTGEDHDARLLRPQQAQFHPVSYSISDNSEEDPPHLRVDKMNSGGGNARKNQQQQQHNDRRRRHVGFNQGTTSFSDDESDAVDHQDTDDCSLPRRRDLASNEFHDARNN